MPGRSMRSDSIVWPPALSFTRAMRASWVVPGKFDVLARMPAMRLKSVVLPTFGLPSTAIVCDDEIESVGIGIGVVIGRIYS